MNGIQRKTEMKAKRILRGGLFFYKKYSEILSGNFKFRVPVQAPVENEAWSEP